MKKYKVKLPDNNKVKPENNVNGYLGDNSPNNKYPMAYHYTRGEALKKAKAFNGKIEAVKTTIVLVGMRIATLAENCLVYDIEKALKGREEFADTNKKIGERIYIADVFDKIRKECIVNAKAQAQLEELCNEMYSYDYVLITK